MKWIVKKANEIKEKYGIDDLELLALKLGAEVVEIPLGRIIKEFGVILIPHLHSIKEKAFNSPWASQSFIP